MADKTGYYIAVDREQTQRQLWFANGDRIVPADGSERMLEPGQKGMRGLRTQLDHIWAHGAPWRTVRATLEPGQYYPRMSRPQFAGVVHAPGTYPATDNYRTEIAGTVGQLRYLSDGLSRLLQVVHPEPRTLQTYGHEIRNLLIIACTEVEAQCKAILDANGYLPIAKRHSTADYVKLNKAMRLPGYSVQLLACPWLPPVAPFAGWQSKQPTKSLPWYDAYNAAKHDRESNFRQAQLQHAISAVCACTILAWCQFGEPAVNAGTDVPSTFRLAKRPVFPLGEIYLQVPAGWPLHLQPVPYRF